METITIGCVGMTHLGLVYSVAFAEKGFNVVAYDNDEEYIHDLQQLKLSINEPQLIECLTTHAKRIYFTRDLSHLTSCNLIFIACDVPTDEGGTSDLTVIYNLIEKTL